MSSGVTFKLDVPGGTSNTKSALKQDAPADAHVAGGGGNRGNRGNRGKGRGNHGKGRGNQPPSQAEIDAKAAEADAKTAEAKARFLRAQADAAKAQADAAEAQVRLNAAQSTAVVTSTPCAKPGATSGGGDYITRDEFNSFQSEVKTGFTHLSEQNRMTHNVLAGFVNMVNSGGLPASATAPVSRKIGYVPASEVAVEPQCQISFGQNAGWDPAAERPGFAQQPTSRASSAIAYGVATEFIRNQEASTFFRESSGGSSIGDARQLGVSHSLPNFEEAARRWNTRRDKNNEKILYAIRQMAGCNDNIACLLLALVNGKTLSEIVKMYNTEVGQLLSTHNTTFFQSFFTALTRCGLPEKFDVKVDSSKTRSGNAFLMTYLQLSQSPSNVDKLVTFLRGE